MPRLVYANAEEAMRARQGQQRNRRLRNGAAPRNPPQPPPPDPRDIYDDNHFREIMPNYDRATTTDFTKAINRALGSPYNDSKKTVQKRLPAYLTAVSHRQKTNLHLLFPSDRNFQQTIKELTEFLFDKNDVLQGISGWNHEAEELQLLRPYRGNI